MNLNNNNTHLNHELFKSLLGQSTLAVDFVASWLRGFGYEVIKPAMKVSPSPELSSQYRDGGDLFVTMRVEVKQLSVNWTGPNDWPYGEKFIVCSKNSFDSARPKPLCYFIVSQNWRSIARVMTDTRKHWTEETKTDRRFIGLKQRFYLCPLQYVHWITPVIREAEWD